jgi:serine/threonine-protein kinase HipA
MIMTDVEVHIDMPGGLRRVGTLRRTARRGGETVVFEYHPDWLADPDRFSLEPAMKVGPGPFVPATGQAFFGSIGDSAPDTWGRSLMRRAERRRAERERRPPRTLSELDFLLGVADVSRLGALRFRDEGREAFRAPVAQGVPGLIDLGRLIGVTERILRDEETDEDLQLIFAPGSSLGGARPKASVIDQHGRLAIAKFPKEADDYPMERWEAIALDLAGAAGIRVPGYELLEVAGRPVMLSRRFDRDGERRIPYLSALSMMGLRDGVHGSYPELVDVLNQHGARAREDAAELYRRMAFNVLVSNVDDHLRNHGFLWLGRGGWTLSPAFDINPTPVDVRPRILTTAIDVDDAVCNLNLVLSVAGYFGLGEAAARAVVRSVGDAVSTWRDIASQRGARPAEIKRMASAFEHHDLTAALAL